VPTRGGKWLPK